MMQAPIRLNCPAEASWWAPLALGVSGLTPAAGATIRFSMRDRNGIQWRSEGRFLADASGCVDIGSCSRGGSWVGSDPEGWWWSMRPAGWRDDRSWLEGALARPGRPLAPVFDPPEFHSSEVDPEAAVTLSITLLSQGWVVRARQRRHRLPPGVRTEAPGAIAGRAYLPAGKPRAALLLIGGSEGGIQALRAAQLADRGVAVLAQAWHNWPGTPDSPANLPIEQFREGLAWLRRRTELERPAVWGSSRGSEAALLLAHVEGSGVGRLVLWVPTHLAHGALAPGARDFRDESAPMWTVGGRPVQPIRWAGPDPAEEATREAALHHPPGWRASDHYRALWAMAGAEAFALPTAGVSAPTLIVAGRDDGLWPSAEGAEELHRRLQGQLPCRLRIFERVGHAIPVPGDPLPFVRTRIWRGQFGIAAGFIDVGGAPADTAAAARASFDEATAFLLGDQPQSTGDGGWTSPPA